MNPVSAATAVPEPELLAAARGGDQAAFRDLIEPYRSRLHAHCYRMLGSIADAEDAVQEALVRAWRGLARFEGRSSFRSWLYRIATNTCLTAIERRPKRVLPLDYGPAADPHDGPGEPLAESVWVEPYPDEGLGLESGLDSPEARYEQREAVELAFIAALQHLPPRQRAVLILRDVLGFSGSEVADALDTTPSSVYSILQRAHQAVDRRLPERTQQATLRSIGDRGQRDLVERYKRAWESGDVEAILGMLRDDATVAMPPRPTWYRGRHAVGAFLARWPLSPGARWRLVPAHANGQLAFATYRFDASRSRYVLHGIDVLALGRGGLINEITAFLDPGIVPAFGLPRELEP